MIPGFGDHSANERTFLAWVRTVVAVEGFGLAAARLGDAAPPSWTEPALLGTGAVVIGLAFLRMRRLRRRIDAGVPGDDDGLPADALLAALVAALFGLLAVFAAHVS